MHDQGTLALPSPSTLKAPHPDGCTPDGGRMGREGCVPALGVHHASDALRNAGVRPEERGSIRVDTLAVRKTVATVFEVACETRADQPQAERGEVQGVAATEVLPSLRGMAATRHLRAAVPVPVVDVRDIRQLAR